MRPTDDSTPNLTEADRVSNTRFGPRPVPRGHIHTSGRGRRVNPRATLSTKIIVWGGVALGVAGATAAALTAARKISDLGDDRRPVRAAEKYYGDRMIGMAPRFAELDEADREAMRKRVRAQAREDAREAARQRADAGRKRGKDQRDGNVARNLTQTASDLSNSIEGVASSLVSAFTSFRGVASQAAGIVAEFAASADMIRSALGRDQAPRSGSAGLPEQQASEEQQDRLHRL